MEKIKHRTIRFVNPRHRHRQIFAILAGVVLGSMAVVLCTMVVLIFR
ncbi:MAG: hypothetical protein IKM39_04885 [Clostridia bacterium]|nr:hypothetical protein [Clostridia bacterium]